MNPRMQDNAPAARLFAAALAKTAPAPLNTRYEARTAAASADVQVIHHNDGRADR